MNDYYSFFLHSSSNVVQLETLEISHPNFSKTYRVVRNNTKGITCVTEDGITNTFDYYPLRINSSGEKGTLDQSINIDFGDLGEIIPKEIDRVASASGFSIRPTVIYRTYRSDDLTKPMFGPVRFEVSSISSNKEGASFEAKAPSLNVNSTGEKYTIKRIPMLRGFL